MSYPLGPKPFQVSAPSGYEWTVFNIQTWILLAIFLTVVLQGPFLRFTLTSVTGHQAQAQNTAPHSTAWAEHLPQAPPEAPVTHRFPAAACLGFCSTCSPGRELLGSCCSPALCTRSSTFGTAEPAEHIFLLPFASSSSLLRSTLCKGSTIELFGPPEFNRSDFSLYRILSLAGWRSCLYLEPAFSSYNVTFVLS